jgi:DNA-binding NarL/FixJ family response regulator
MSQVSLPVTRPAGRALLVSNPAARADVRATLARLGYGCGEADDPYAAMAELCRRPLVYRAMILSLSGLYREELSVISAVKRRYPHVEVWLAHTDGRLAALAEAMSLGADGLLDEDGLHRVAVNSLGRQTASAPEVEDLPDLPTAATLSEQDELQAEEPILSSDELKALLQEQPSVPPAAEEN